MPDVRLAAPETFRPEADVERLQAADKTRQNEVETPPRINTDDRLAASSEQTPEPIRSETDSTVPLETRVERLLAEGLKTIYAAMPPERRQQFKQAGESAARRLAALLAKPHPSVEAAIQTIVDWLKIIPDANPYYLEQEGTIKAEKIISLIHPPTA